MPAVPQPLPQDLPGFDLYGLFLEYHGTDIADPKEMARNAYYDIPEDARATILQDLLGERFREWTRSHRHRFTAVNDSAKWRDVADANASGALAVFRLRVCVGPGWKQLGDCSPTDVEQVAAYNRKQADLNASMARRFQRLAIRMRQRNAATVDQLDPNLVRQILSTEEES